MVTENQSLVEAIPEGMKARVLTEEDVKQLKASNYPQLAELKDRLPEFESGAISGLEFSCGGHTHKLYGALANFCKRHAGNLIVRRRGKSIFVVRKDLVME